MQVIMMRSAMLSLPRVIDWWTPHPAVVSSKLCSTTRISWVEVQKTPEFAICVLISHISHTSIPFTFQCNRCAMPNQHVLRIYHHWYWRPNLWNVLALHRVTSRTKLSIGILWLIPLRNTAMMLPSSQATFASTTAMSYVVTEASSQQYRWNNSTMQDCVRVKRISAHCIGSVCDQIV